MERRGEGLKRVRGFLRSLSLDQEGWREGREWRAEEIVCNMLAEGVDDALIRGVTGFSKERLRKIKSSFFI